MKWIKLTLAFLGNSNKHAIFRVRKWDKSYERIFKKLMFTEQYEKIGKIHDIFGPAKHPFLSVTLDKPDFEPLDNYYVKMSK